MVQPQIFHVLVASKYLDSGSIFNDDRFFSLDIFDGNFIAVGNRRNSNNGTYTIFSSRSRGASVTGFSDRSRITFWSLDSEDQIAVNVSGHLAVID